MSFRCDTALLTEKLIENADSQISKCERLNTRRRCEHPGIAPRTYLVIPVPKGCKQPAKGVQSVIIQKLLKHETAGDLVRCQLGRASRKSRPRHLHGRARRRFVACHESSNFFNHRANFSRWSRARWSGERQAGHRVNKFIRYIHTHKSMNTYCGKMMMMMMMTNIEMK